FDCTYFQIGSGKVDQTYTLELENNISIGAGLVIHKLKCLSQGGPVWEAILTSRGAGIAGSRHAACVVCEDSTLSVFSAGGQRLLPPVVLSSPATRLTCSDQYVMVLTSRGCVSVWNIQELKTLVKNESLLPIMQAPAGTDLSIRSTGLTEHGAPVVSLSTRKSYIFNFDVGAWLLISSADDAVYQCSDHQSCLPPDVKLQETLLPLASLQGELNRPTRVARNIFNSNPVTRRAATLSHLDSQLAAALSMHSAKDYKFWFLTLVRYLTQEGLEPRLRELCSELLGPVVQTTRQSSWKSYTMGLSKRELLREILPVMGSNLKLQRLVTEFKEQLDVILT
ncbi:protein HIRA-like, partial [Limulus polyphemus]|uniref:Protein HIRA-like n=1 Tax=Limulus polyphemus TaxID=6850 RepID=A0ABM1TSJ6_LIMPO